MALRHPHLPARLIEARKQRNVSRAAIAQALGVTEQAVGNWERGENEPSTANLVNLAEFLEAPLSSLIGVYAIQVETEHRLTSAMETRRAQLAEASTAFESETVTPARSTLPQDVPVLGTVVGGSQSDFHLNGDTVDWARRPPGLALVRDAYAVFVTGDSMAPRFEPGEMLFANPGRPPRSGDDVIVQIHPEDDGEPVPCFVKRFVKRTPSLVICEQFNPPRTVEYTLSAVLAIHRIMPLSELFGI